jgi:hypothetical protein
MTTLTTISRTMLGGLVVAAALPALWPGDAAAHTCDAPFSTDLIAGQRIDAGDVEVCNDDATLTVIYEATFPWCLLETDLHVARSESDIPQTGTGNPMTDEFEHGDGYGGCLDGPATFEIPLDEIDGGVGHGDSVVIAAHAEVEDGERQESAWGKGTRFVARGSWAMYFEYTVQETAVPCPEASVAGLTAFADRISTASLHFASCDFDAARAAGSVRAEYDILGQSTIQTGVATVGASRCQADIETGGVRELERFVNISISSAEQASCAPLAVDILPLLDETTCDISPPELAFRAGGAARERGGLTADGRPLRPQEDGGTRP